MLRLPIHRADLLDLRHSAQLLCVWVEDVYLRYLGVPEPRDDLVVEEIVRRGDGGVADAVGREFELFELRARGEGGRGVGGKRRTRGRVL